MFQVGDKIVYPMHGAGVIEAIEEREFLGRRRRYYILHMPLGALRAMIPLDQAEDLGVRPVLPKEALVDLEAVLRRHDAEPDKSWNQRYRKHLDQLKTGDVFAVADVVRTLMRRERRRALSGGERRMLENARMMLVSELVLSQNIDEAAAQAWLERAVFGPEAEESGV
ncbi:CarD family transcriptional regulator [Hydrogenibacillus schlegelii]|uniref:CarD family transcriptional regulator n=1 Tax=Hydrogenibacillus schlegelii TaxID=1484 RepID=A0A132NCL0_HYDSH|nr:CarD family transcriptional regulator [Hydrogenibacillus schlegelii]KWX07760.1 CarD family transcriptional regulator [Hydrogenibacillus schlegelii]MBT9283132.1 CarD family transcriptional regulator [Hydrogenibacillus schlegelii]OAR04543.1 CarD family transcriptional regulator [Hydrogenibacillus schlegelii]PTQ51920.1 MAG: CarD-like transcriptional regulator [Hydrogenibacillus schlegelii]